MFCFAVFLARKHSSVFSVCMFVVGFFFVLTKAKNIRTHVKKKCLTAKTYDSLAERHLRALTSSHDPYVPLLNSRATSSDLKAC